MNPENPADIDLAGVVERVRQDVARRRASLHGTPVRAVPAPEGRGPQISEKSYTLNDFLVLQDADFIAHAYRALLRRNPDPAGYGHYLDALRSGRLAKTEIVGRIRYSKEGRAKRVAVKGLAVPFVIRCLRRVPLLGHVVGVVQYSLRLPTLVRNHERLEAVVFHRDAEMRAVINAKAAELEASAARAQRRLDAAISDLAHAAQGRDRTNRIRLEELSARTASLERASSDLSAVDEDLRQTMQTLDGRKAELSQLETLAAAVAELTRMVEREGAERAGERNDYALEGFYARFEDHFRGSREDIKARVAEHLPIIRIARAGTAEAPVLDLGCGRGEWLEVLAGNGMVGRGVDLSAVMVQRSLELGLDAVQSDALQYLRSLPSDSLGAVTGFHLIEHLAFRQLVALLDETWRTLRPGGLALFETPNPENLIVGACNFWYDPTHVKPLPPEMMRFVFEARGFARVDIVRLHPFPPEVHLAEGAESVRSRLNELLYGWQDYAIVAYKD